MLETRHTLTIKLDNLLRLVMLHTLSGALPLYIVTEYPKSGGTWVSQMLAEYLGVAFPRNRRARLEPSVMHGHYLYSRSFRNVLCVLRDGRDVMVSLYHHRLLSEAVPPRVTARFRRALSFDDRRDVRANLPRFIEFEFMKAARRPLHFDWSRFVRCWVGRGAPIVRYEDLLRGVASVLGPPIERLTGAPVDMERLRVIESKYAFEKQAGRRAGREDQRSFLRKGVAGDWCNYFSAEAREVFAHYAGEALVLAGYERDGGWVRATPADG